MTENFLEHFGIKGMKWGIRRNLRRGRSKSSKEVAKTLTNAELKKRISRLNMEKQYADLAKAEPSAVEKGGRIVGGILGTAAKQTTQAIANETTDFAADLLRVKVGLSPDDD